MSKLRDKFKDLKLFQALKNIRIPAALKRLKSPKVIQKIKMPKTFPKLKIPAALKNNVVVTKLKSLKIPTQVTRFWDERVLLWWNGLSSREHVIIKVLGGLVAVLVFVLLIFKPLVIDTIKLSQELSVSKNQLTAVEAQKQGLEVKIKTEAQFLREIAQTKRTAEGAVPLFLDHIGAQQIELGFKVTAISMPQAAHDEVAPILPPSPAGQQPQPAGAEASGQAQPAQVAPITFEKVQVEFRALASYMEIGKFLQSLDSLPIVVMVTDMDIQKGASSERNTVRITFQVISKRQT